tara:strand:- start:288 stop:494 length:207 start_codon:yes stop_codon:yes gene_type:complete
MEFNRREIMENIMNKGYEIEVTYKNGDKSSKFFTINQLQKATNYFNKMNNSIDKNVHKVKSKIAKVIF